LKPVRSPDFDAWLASRRIHIDHALDAVLSDHPALDPRLDAACRHALLLGGKRLRPALVCAGCEAFGGRPETGARAGTAVELIHAYSLVHDDLPAMDDDALRRGHPTVHVQFDEATAILAGDALLTLAFEVLAGDPGLGHLPAEQRLAMIARLGRAAGAAGMVGGQALDMAATGSEVDEAGLMRIHAGKTGALIGAAVDLGALAAGVRDPSTLASLTRFGDALGLAFQIVDDLLDVTAETSALGKTAGSDAAGAKSTYVGLLGIDGARERAADACTRALEALEELDDPGHLPDFVHWVRDRSH
jgi:geranylgeranyl pyrophosphate synthase